VGEEFKNSFSIGLLLFLLIPLLPWVVICIFIYYAVKVLMEAAEKSGEKNPSGEETAEVSERDYHDAVAALSKLGFTKAEAREAVQKAMEQGAIKIEDLLKKAIQSRG
jgi:Holliday junction resolvasome RuvABC DNA-binding subunit